MGDTPDLTSLPDQRPDNVMDLEAYRKKRIEEGTWPIPNEDHFKFFYHWKQARKK